MFLNHIKSAYWRDIYYLASGNTIAQMIGIFGIPVLTRLYTPEAFAAQSIFLQALMLISGFITWRYEYFFQLVETDKEANLLMKWILHIGLWMTLLITMLIGMIEYFDFQIGMKKNWFDFLYFVPISAFLVSFALSLQHNVQRKGDFKSSGLSEVAGKSCYIASATILSVITSVFGLITATAFSAVGKMISLRTHLLSLLKTKSAPSVIKHPRSTFFSRANGLVFSNMLVSFSGALPVFYIGSEYGENILGQYALVMSTVFLPSSLLGAAIGNVFYQRAAVYWNNKNTSKIIALWKETLLKLSLLGIPVYGALYMISDIVYPLIFGSQWVQAGYFGKIIAIYAFCSFLAGPIDKISLVLGFSFYPPIIHTVRLIVILIGIYFTKEYQLTPDNYILLLSITMAMVYMFDLVGGRFLIKIAKNC